MKHLVALLFLSSLVIAKKITCPDKKSSCPETNTCCELVDGSYGCCVAKNGVCCDDHIHCCPQNTKCSNGDCIQTYETNFTRSGLPLIPSNIVTCPSSNSTCPDFSTCCFDNPDTHSYKCCPLEDAVCCNDGVHCCPTGTVCNVAEQTCDGDRFKHKIFSTKKHKFVGYKHHIYSTTKQKPPVAWAKISMRQKFQKTEKANSVVCPGSEFQCPDGYSCCKRPDGNWGCCPFPNAFCCTDGLHCCPENMHCDATSQYCTQVDYRGSVVTAGSKIPAQRIEKVNPEHISSSSNETSALKVGTNCPDNSTCEYLATCCKVSATKYGCCNYPDADCCIDMKHCCIRGYKCDAQSQCIPQDETVKPKPIPSASIKTLALKVGTTCPDKSICDDLDTCCKISAAKFGCCHYANATCCSDMQHCCPQGYKCDVQSNKCLPRDE